ncbi:Tic20 family protein [Baaleninema simplex]|uniref:Tic20 family protein n=1 Tax=Baaleninema simplex TaxID=2862350 RepID=UPI00035E7ACD|nr:Tic20 family protein [Baaleninema simplex]
MNDRSDLALSTRILSAVMYLIPLVEGVVFGTFLFRQFPVLQVVFVPLLPLIQLYNSIPFGRLLVFFILFFTVVRNTNLDRFVRYNAMQALFLSIILSISSLLLSLFASGLQQGAPLLLETLVNTLFLGVVAAVGYSLVQCVRGRYPEIPALSDAVNMQVPY